MVYILKSKKKLNKKVFLIKNKKKNWVWLNNWRESNFLFKFMYYIFFEESFLSWNYICQWIINKQLLHNGLLYSERISFPDIFPKLWILLFYEHQVNLYYMPECTKLVNKCCESSHIKMPQGNTRIAM